MATIEELEARVAALEAAAAADEYTIQQSGETIDSILAGIKDAAIYHGTTEIVIDTGDNNGSATLDLGFAPNANTKIIGSVRRNISPSGPFGVVLMFYYYMGHITAYITHGYNHGNDFIAIPSGTYYVDWICIDTGEEAS